MKYNILNIRFLLIILAFITLSKSWAQNITATLDADTIRIGEQVNINLSVTAPKSSKIIFSNLNTDTISDKIEIIEILPIDSVATENPDIYTYIQKVSITSFDTGVHVIPPFQVEIQKNSSDINTVKLSSEPLLLVVLTVKVDTNKDIKDIKPIQKVPISFKEILPYILIFLLIVALITFLIYFIRRKRKNKPILQLRKVPALPAWQIALNDLQNLKDKDYPNKGKIKQYYTELTDIFRLYLEKQFNIEALEMISSEIIESLKENKFDDELISSINETLIRTDLVKFAKQNTTSFENHQSFENIYNFVNKTKPVSEANLEKETNNNTENSKK